jgi:hypothetical protein
MKPHHLIWLIVAGVLAWGIFHALGTYLNYQYQSEAYPNPWRTVMVLGCVAAFVGFWAVMLVVRNARVRRQQSSDSQSPHA